MHELAVCQGILEVAGEALDGLPPPRPRVSRIDLRVGRLTAVVPDALRYHFQILAAGTPFDGAFLAIEEVPIRGRCLDCGAAVELPALPFACRACDSGLVEVTSGRELEVVSLETLEAARAG